MLNDRLGSRRTLLWASLASAAVSLGFAACHGLWGHYAVLIVYTLVSGTISGVLYSATLALYMNLSDPRIAATQFQIYMSLFNLKDAWAQKWGGRLAEHFPATGMFGLAAVLEVLPLALLPWVAERHPGHKPGDTMPSDERGTSRGDPAGTDALSSMP
jgi:MFS family permease